MRLTETYIKTADGRREIESRARSLDQRQRMLLIMVNGKISVERLAERMRAMGDIIPTLEYLANEGLIEPVRESNRRAPAAEYSPPSSEPAGAPVLDLQHTKQHIETLLEEYFGPMAGPLVIKLNACKHE